MTLVSAIISDVFRESNRVTAVTRGAGYGHEAIKHAA